MKKISLFIWGLVSMLLLINVSCEKDESTPTSAKDFKVVTDRVIDVTYDTIDEETAMKYIAKFDMQMGGCSAVKVLLDGKTYVGRDYDFYCSNAPTVIVRNNSGAVRTIGLCNTPQHLEAWTNADEYTISEKAKVVLPYLCCDVMSEAGIYAETNIRVYEEQTACNSTNPGKPRRCTQTFMQTMLSNYTSIQQICEHVNDYDWYDLQLMGFHQSFMLTDKNGYSVVFEFAKNKVYWQESDRNANFFLNEDLYATEKYPCGELRLEHELALKSSVQSPDDIFTMMKAGAYDQFYHLDTDVDYAIPEFFSEIGYDRFSYADDVEGARQAMKDYIQNRGELTWQQRVDKVTWETVLAVVANVSDLEMKVHFSEHFNIDFTVNFE